MVAIWQIGDDSKMAQPGVMCYEYHNRSLDVVARQLLERIVPANQPILGTNKTEVVVDNAMIGGGPLLQRLFSRVGKALGIMASFRVHFLVYILLPNPSSLY